MVCHEKTDGIWEFLPNTNWNGEIPCTLASEFFAFTDHERPKLKSVLVFSGVLSNISIRMRLCCSTNSLLKGDSEYESDIHWLGQV